jgi:putative transposase
MGRRGYPPEFRRKVLDLIDAGRKVTDIARDLGISNQTIYIWRKQHRIDQGLEPGLSTGERAELLAARRRIAQLETELKIARRATELLKDVKPPKVRYAAIKVMAAEKLPVQSACRILDVSESGFYAWLVRPPSERAIRHAWLTDLATEIHNASRQTYGAQPCACGAHTRQRRDVGYNQVALVMRRAGLKGLMGYRKRPRIERPDVIAMDLVDRSFSRSERDRLWLTDITEHPTREGKLYCCVVLDVFSRRVVGWSIDSSPTAGLVTNALGMAIGSRNPRPGTLIHSDQGTQFTSWAFTHRAKASGLVPSMGVGCEK